MSEQAAGRLSGKVAWVTGSSRGIGRVVADHLAALGAKVAVHGTTPTSTRAFDEADSLAAVADEIAAAHDADVLAVHGDLTSESVVRDLVAQIRDRFAKIDILVNNAGGDIGSQGTGGERAGKPVVNDAVNVSLEDVRTVLDRNLMTCILVCREVCPEMMARNSGWDRHHRQHRGAGRARLGSHLRHRQGRGPRVHPLPRRPTAPARRLRQRHRARGDHHGALRCQPPDAGRTQGSRRGADPLRLAGEVAKTVEFLVTEDSSYITGQILRIDGGAQLFPA